MRLEWSTLLCFKHLGSHSKQTFSAMTSDEAWYWYGLRWGQRHSWESGFQCSLPIDNVGLSNVRWLGGHWHNSCFRERGYDFDSSQWHASNLSPWNRHDDGSVWGRWWEDSPTTAQALSDMSQTGSQHARSSTSSVQLLRSGIQMWLHEKKDPYPDALRTWLRDLGIPPARCASRSVLLGAAKSQLSSPAPTQRSHPTLTEPLTQHFFIGDSSPETSLGAEDVLTPSLLRAGATLTRRPRVPSGGSSPGCAIIRAASSPAALRRSAEPTRQAEEQFSLVTDLRPHMSCAFGVATTSLLLGLSANQMRALARACVSRVYRHVGHTCQQPVLTSSVLLRTVLRHLYCKLADKYLGTSDMERPLLSRVCDRQVVLPDRQSLPSTCHVELDSALSLPSRTCAADGFCKDTCKKANAQLLSEICLRHVYRSVGAAHVETMLPQPSQLHMPDVDCKELRGMALQVFQLQQPFNVQAHARIEARKHSRGFLQFLYRRTSVGQNRLQAAPRICLDCVYVRLSEAMHDICPTQIVGHANGAQSSVKAPCDTENLADFRSAANASGSNLKVFARDLQYLRQTCDSHLPGRPSRWTPCKRLGGRIQSCIDAVPRSNAMSGGLETPPACDAHLPDIAGRLGGGILKSWEEGPSGVNGASASSCTLTFAQSQVMQTPALGADMPGLQHAVSDAAIGPGHLSCNWQKRDQNNTVLHQEQEHGLVSALSRSGNDARVQGGGGTDRAAGGYHGIAQNAAGHTSERWHRCKEQHQRRATHDVRQEDQHSSGDHLWDGSRASGWRAAAISLPLDSAGPSSTRHLRRSTSDEQIASLDGFVSSDGVDSSVRRVVPPVVQSARKPLLTDYRKARNGSLPHQDLLLTDVCSGKVARQLSTLQLRSSLSIHGSALDVKTDVEIASVLTPEVGQIERMPREDRWATCVAQWRLETCSKQRSQSKSDQVRTGEISSRHKE